jgi:AcrR family transcriptional regulator
MPKGWRMHTHQQVIRERKSREKDQRIQSILAAAKKVFFSKGYVKATMDEVAFEAQISKPTIYQYFRTKDELYSSLMLPFLEEFGSRFERIEKKLKHGKYATGRDLVKDIFRLFIKSYERAPDSMRVANTFFQHQDLISQLSPEARSAISSKGKYDFQIARGVIETAIAQGLIRDIDSYALSDIIWGIFLGLTQVMDMKSTKQGPTDTYLKSALRLAERLITDAIVLK